MSNATTTARPCVYCGAEVTSPVPEVDYCRNCHYNGLGEARRFAALIDELEALPQVGLVDVWHTGGGCFGLAIRLPARGEEAIVFATVAYEEEDGTWWPEAVLPEAEAGPWGVGTYLTDDEYMSGEPQGGYACPLDREGLLKYAAEAARAEA